MLLLYKDTHRKDPEFIETAISMSGSRLLRHPRNGRRRSQLRGARRVAQWAPCRDLPRSSKMLLVSQKHPLLAKKPSCFVQLVVFQFANLAQFGTVYSPIRASLSIFIYIYMISAPVRGLFLRGTACISFGSAADRSSGQVLFGQAMSPSDRRLSDQTIRVQST